MAQEATFDDIAELLGLSHVSDNWRLVKNGRVIVSLIERQHYCDRGRYHMIEATPLWKSDADQGVRYFFDRERAQLELEAYMVAKGIDITGAVWEPDVEPFPQPYIPANRQNRANAPIMAWPKPDPFPIFRHYIQRWPKYQPEHILQANSRYSGDRQHTSLMYAEYRSIMDRERGHHLALELQGTKAYLLSICVGEAERGKGYGSLLYRIAEATAKEAGCEVIIQTPSGCTYNDEDRKAYLRRRGWRPFNKIEMYKDLRIDENGT